METKFLKFIPDYASPSDKLVVAVSGGVDSVVLLHLLSRYSTNLYVAHLNHGLRRESVAEEKFVRQLADRYNLPYFTRQLTLKKGSEEEARKARYQFLNEVLKENKAKYIVTAHHLNDQAESVLLNLTRGSGPLEVWGMKAKEGNILRPLLGYSKEEITGYAKRKGLKYVLDKSNTDPRYSRNRIRKSVIPELLKLNPAFLKAISREITLGDELAEAVEYYGQEIEKSVRVGGVIDVRKLKNHPIYFQKLVIRNLLHEMIGRKEGIYAKNVNEVMGLMTGSGRKLTKISGFTIVRNYDKIVFDFRPQKIQKSTVLESGRETIFNGFKIILKAGAAKAKRSNLLLPRGEKYNFKVRTWRAGDRIVTKAGSKKIQDIFTDAKIPKEERDRWPVITSGKTIFWVPLLAASEKALSKSTNALIIEVKHETKTKL